MSIDDQDRSRIAVLELLDRQPIYPDGFTDAERDVAHLVFEGMTNAEIACRRNTSARTVAKQVSSILRKAEVQSRAQLVLRLLGQDVPD